MKFLVRVKSYKERPLKKLTLKELVQLNVCENCLLLLEKKGKMQSFDGEFLIRVDTDKTGRRVFTIKDRYNE